MTVVRIPVLARALISLDVWALYGLALWLPVVDLPRTDGIIDLHGPMQGWQALLFCWIPPLCVPWLANWVFLVGWILFFTSRVQAAFWLGVAASLLGLTTLLFFWNQWGALRMGYLLWEASFLMLMGAAWIFRRSVRQPARTE